ncbi:MAG: hypothetical protein PQJ50_09255, partial [Spirochaetales bacterium]|nr:hypothetical protein [Spirochaetales bacterium]
MSELSMGNKEVFLRKLKKETGDILESQFRIDINTKDKVLEEYFTKGYLPRWYFYSHSADTIAHHIYMLTHFLNANSDMLSQAGMSDNSKTYFINVGRDYPGRLSRIIEKNLSMDIVAMDSESTASGLRIVTIDKRGENYVVLSKEERKNADILREHVIRYGKENRLKYAEEFLETLGHKYLKEELSVQRYPDRIFRHLHLYEKACSSGKVVVESAIINDTLRLSMAGINPDRRFIHEALRYYKTNRINLERSYFDLFETGERQVGIFSIYIKNPTISYKELEEEMKRDLAPYIDAPGAVIQDSLESRIEVIIRKLSSPLKKESLEKYVDELKALCRENLVGEGEIVNFYLNSVTDFLEAAEKAGLADNPRILKILLGFEQFDDFF